MYEVKLRAGLISMRRRNLAEEPMQLRRTVVEFESSLLLEGSRY